jgi:cytochrome d ubiquinol oxidase subunit I
MEALWDTNKPGTGAAWAILADPNPAEQKNNWEISVPYVTSLIVTHSPTGTVQGLTDFKRADQPPVLAPFYGFRVMVAAGVFIAFMTLVTIWMLWRRKAQMQVDSVSSNKWLLRGWLWTIPAAYIAIEAGWLVREIGRQPWIVYGMMRTSEGVSRVPVSVLQWSLLSYVVFYTAIGVAALIFMRGVLRKGPVFEAPPHQPVRHRDIEPKPVLEGGH